MLQQVNQTESRELQRACQAVSPMDEPCDHSASYHCRLPSGSNPRLSPEPNPPEAYCLSGLAAKRGKKV